MKLIMKLFYTIDMLTENRKTFERQMNWIGQEVKVNWVDSYGVTPAWQDLNDFDAILLRVRSYGVVIKDTPEILVLAHNYAEETEFTPEQANGTMVIPKACITDITSFSSCPVPEKEPMQQQTSQP